MIPWFEYVQVGVAVVAGMFCLALGLAGRRPSDYTLGVTALVELLLIAQVVIALVPRRPATCRPEAGWSSGLTYSPRCCCRLPPCYGRSSIATDGAQRCSGSPASLSR